ncbi:MAG: hypothetical protein KAJ51_07920, partial [Thermoplasmata archaeon]|nr:hypothetical protein [Thermoplasmata archaeon]
INDTMDIDFTNFTLIVIDVNDNPIINTSNIEITYEDKLYEVDYNATDIDSPFEKQIWSLETNASSWLSIDSVMGIVSGTPVNDDVGNYWVNISIDDGEAGKDYTNFTLIVMNVNDPPVIVTANLQTTMTGKLYKVDYNATDIDPTNDTLSWSLATNASWLSIDSFTGILSGIPTTNDFGRFDLNVTVDDGNSGLDWTEFILTVEKGPTEYNEPPLITTIDRVSAAVDVLYKVDYDATDDRTPIDLLTWELVTNASWLSITSSIGVLTGTPTSNDLGWYWVNVSVNDDEGKSDFHNFTLTVFSTANLPPEIITEDIRYAIVDILYSVDYDATDDRTPVAYLQWSLTTNASWLNITPTTGVLSGTPRISNVGWYTVSVFVNDSEDGWDYHDFIITVTTEPISENKAPKLSYPKLNPSDGDAETEFTFSVHYYDEDGDAPTFIRVIIDNESYDMILSHDNPSNGTYQYCTKLSEGTHTYYFIASDGVDIVETGKFTTSSIDKGKDKISNEDFFWIWLILIVVVIIIVLILLFIFLKKKKEKEEEAPVEEAPPPPPEEPLAEVPPPEQPPAVTQPPLGQQSLAPTVTVTEPQMPQIEPPPAPPQPVMQPTVTPQIIPTITQPTVTEQPESDEELEE